MSWLDDFLKKPGKIVEDAANTVFGGAASGVSALGKAAGISNVTTPISGAITSLANNSLNTINKGINDVGATLEKGAGDVANTLKKAGGDASRYANEVAKEGSKFSNIATAPLKFQTNAILDTMKSLSKGDLKGTAGNILKYVDSAKQGNIDTFKYVTDKVTDPSRELARATKWKELQDINKNISREVKKGADTYGPLIQDVALDIASDGAYSSIRKTLEAIEKDGINGVLNDKFLKDAAIDAAATYIGAKYKIKPQYLKAAVRASDGDLEGAAAQSFNVNPEYVKLAKDLAEGNKQKILDTLGKLYGGQFSIPPEITGLATATLAGRNPKIESFLKNYATSAAESYIPKGLDNSFVKKMKSTLGSKTIADVAGNYYGIDPSIIKSAGKFITNPKGEAISALSNYSGVNPNQIQNIRSALSGDLKGTAMQSLASRIGIPSSELGIYSNLGGEDFRSLPFQALADQLGVDPSSLKIARDLYRGRLDQSNLNALSNYDDIVREKMPENNKYAQDRLNISKKIANFKKIGVPSGW